MKYTFAIISGDGIGPEVTNQAKKALDAIAEVYDHVFLYKEAKIGACAIAEHGTPLPKETITICKEADAILYGAVGDPKYDNDPSSKIRPEQGILQLRQELELFCNIRPIKAYNKLLKNSPLKREVVSGTDVAIFRELTGGIYFGKKEISKDGKVAFDGCQYSEKEILRVAHLAFKAAGERRKKILCL